MEKSTDIAIIGGGLASLAAALALQDSGKEITLIRKAPGAAALSSGAFELGDNPFRYPGGSWREFPPVEDNLRNILQRDPHHPLQTWRSVWGLGKLFSFLQEQVTSLKENLPLTLSGDGDYPMALPTEQGTVFSAGLCQASMGGGDLRGMEGADVLVVGIEGLASFRAPFIAQSLSDAVPDFFSSVTGCEITLPFLKSNASLSPFEIAEALDQEEGKSLGPIFERVLSKKKVSHVLLPPVMGMIHSKEILRGLEKSFGRTFAETTAGLPSVPGWRLSEAILRYFKSQGYDIIPAEVVGYEGQNRLIQSLLIHSGPERLRLNARQVILATGKFLGGGLQDREGMVREPVFGLPLFLQGKPLAEWSRRDLFATDPGADQPIFSAGVRVNPQGQVLGNQQEVLWENLFACGMILSGIGVGGDKSSSAVSLISGRAVAKES